ncbi:hypothetical protein BpHYR1_021871 [Brachionus plicatilis]|uniref:Uncharacterized protein n=1 Tax=Brachionus plicatilis TaxID=10195 RepID=A0A3M7T4L8_BRAPC|nr:hypothetical protein BpHYR1_021871 [Brachionus plicatilis]
MFHQFDWLPAQYGHAKQDDSVCVSLSALVFDIGFRSGRNNSHLALLIYRSACLIVDFVRRRHTRASTRSTIAVISTAVSLMLVRRRRAGQHRRKDALFAMAHILS